MDVAEFITDYYKRNLILPSLKLLKEKFPEHSKSYIIDVRNKHFNNFYFGRRRKKHYISMFKSPYVAEIDLGFISYKSSTQIKKSYVYGNFLVAKSVYSGHIALEILKSKKKQDILESFSKILQNPHFIHIKQYLCDQESSFHSQSVKDYIKEKFDVSVLTSSVYKRFRVENAIKNIKDLFRKKSLALDMSLFHVFKNKTLIRQIVDTYNKQFATAISPAKQIKTFFDKKDIKKIYKLKTFPYKFKRGDKVFLYRKSIEKNKIDYKYTRDSIVQVCIL